MTPTPEPEAKMTQEDDGQAKADRALDWIDAEADKWAVEVKLPEIIKNLSAVTTLTPRAPEKVREDFRNRLEQNIDALVRQTFLEAWLRCYDGRKEWESGEIARLKSDLASALEALKPFAEEAFRYDPPENDDDNRVWDCRLTVGDLRRAAAELEKHK